MRRFAIVGIPVALLAATIVPSRAATTPTYDWVLMTVTAGAHGAHTVALDLHARGRTAPSGTPVLGIGLGALPMHLHSVDIASFPEPASRVRVTTPAGNRRFTLRQRRDNSTIEAEIGGGSSMSAGETDAFLLFATAGHFVGTPTAEATAAAGSVITHVLTGSGSTSWTLGDASGLGTATSSPLAGAGAGLVHHRFAQRSGVVGGFARQQPVQANTFAWQAPDGRQGAGRSLDTPTIGIATAPDFAGPAGDWVLTWRGAMAGEWGTTIAAWAPIGSYWHMFA